MTLRNTKIQFLLLEILPVLKKILSEGPDVAATQSPASVATFVFNTLVVYTDLTAVVIPLSSCWLSSCFFIKSLPPLYIYIACVLCVVPSAITIHVAWRKKVRDNGKEGKKAATNQEQAPVLHFKGLTLRATSFSTHH